MILVDANNGIKPMTKEHIFLCVTLKIPFIIVVSKIDICKTRQNVLEETINSINKFLNYPGIRRIPIHVKSIDDIILSTKNIHGESITPVFYTSCVTGEGMDNLKLFLNILGKKPEEKKDNSNVEFHIDHIFNVRGFGTVLGGYLVNGKIKVGDKLLLGPNTGIYENITIRSIYSKKVALQEVNYGSYICVGIKIDDKSKIKKGNVILSLKCEKLVIRRFKAEINVLRSHSTTIKVGYEPMMNTSSIRQTIKIIEILDNKVLRNGDIATVILEFKYRPEYLKKGARFVLSEGRCKIFGEVL
jgi:GTPase